MGNENTKTLSREELDLFVSSTKFTIEKIQENYEFFNMFAEDDKLKPETCVSLFSMFLPGKNSHELIKIMFESFDTDNNGYLDFKEFLIGMAIIESNDNKDGFVKLFFKLSDKDKSNGIDPKELKQFLTFCIEIYKEAEQTNEIDQLKENIEKIKLENANPEEDDKQAEKLTNESDELAKNLDELVKEAFEKYDKEKKGFLNEEDFGKFYEEFDKNY